MKHGTVRIKYKEVGFRPLTLEIDINSEETLRSFIDRFYRWDDKLHQILSSELEKHLERENDAIANKFL